MSKEDFKNFVKNNPSLITYVNNKEKTWQEFYEMYDLYGEDYNVWSSYTASNNYYDTNDTRSYSDNMKPEEAVKELVTMIKGIDLEKVRKGINSVQKTISLVQDLGIGKDTKIDGYESRPIYQHFED